MRKVWYISHPSGGHQHSPGFFHAVSSFAATQEGIEIVLPTTQNELHVTKDAIAKSDLVIAEVSLPSTGSGIELGWANAYDKRIVGFYQAGAQPSPAVKFVSNELHSYVTEDDVTAVLRTFA